MRVRVRCELAGCVAAFSIDASPDAHLCIFKTTTGRAPPPFRRAMSAADSLRRVLATLEAAAARCSRPPPRLVAVSKTKPVEAVEDVYNAGHR